MSTIADKSSEYKRAAAEFAAGLVRSRMVVGLGHGSTAAFAVAKLGELLGRGELTGIIGIPCSDQTETLARKAGIPVGTLDEHPEVDLTIDGADEVDPRLDMIKGGGGALLREKVVAQASKRRVYVIDESKRSPRLGTLHAVPVEVIRVAWKPLLRYLESLGAKPVLRCRNDGTPFLTDQGNMILDCKTGPIAKPDELASALQSRAGIAGHGLFLRLATDLIVAGANGIEQLAP